MKERELDEKIVALINEFVDGIEKEMIGEDDEEILEEDEDDDKPPDPAEAKIILDERIDKCVKSEGGLCPHEIFALNYIEQYYTDQKKFHEFWLYELWIYDVRSIIDKLHREGFAEIDGIAGTIKNLKLPELKELADEFNIKKTGNKPDIVERIINSVKPEILEKRYSKRYYKLTDAGRRELKNGEYTRNCVGSIGLDMWSFNLLLGAQTERYKEVLRELLDKKSAEHFANKEFQMYMGLRSIILNKFYKGDYREEFVYLCEKLCYYFDFLTEDAYKLKRWKNKGTLEKYDMDNIKWSSKIAFDTAKNDGMTENSMKELFFRKAEKYIFPQTAFTWEECWQIIVAGSKEDMITVVEILSAGRDRLCDRLGIKSDCAKIDELSSLGKDMYN